MVFKMTKTSKTLKQVKQVKKTFGLSGLSYIIREFQNRIPLKPVLGGVYSVATFINVNEQSQSNRDFRSSFQSSHACFSFEDHITKIYRSSI